MGAHSEGFEAERRSAVLLVNDNDWMAGALETILEPAGYVVARSYTKREGIRRARTRNLDAVIVESRLPDGDGPSTCLERQRSAEVGHRTPLFISYRERPSRVERRAALRAGAWHLLEPPIDPEFLLLHLGVYIEARREAERYREIAMLDEETGFYSPSAIERRAEEMAAWAARAREPLACVILAPASGDGLGKAVEAIARTLHKAGRQSDTIGRASESEFAILAPATDANGAKRMAERLWQAMDPAFSGELRAGYDVRGPMGPANATGRDLLHRARRAMAHAGNGNGWIAGEEN